MSLAASPVQQFLELVRKSGIVEVEHLRQFEADAKAEIAAGDAAAVAAKLVRLKLISLFHAKNLLAGKYKGFLLGAYKILQPIGSGGMGVVYLAEHKDLKRLVALKVLPADKAKDKATRDRFYREARAAAALDHPNIVRIHDITQGGDLHFIVLEYVEGINLHDLLLKTGPLHHSQAANYIAQAAAGLYHAHQKGFVHRDIKPANLILDKQGVVRILDMGLAKSFGGDDKDNVTKQLDDNAVVGTADIISPEQALNEPVDHRSDIYSLGITLFMLMSGRPPFEGNTAQKLVQHQLKDAPSLTKIRTTIPTDMSKVVIKMMAKKPEDRYQSAREVIEALAPWLPDEATRLDLDGVMPTVRMGGEASTSTIRSGMRPLTKRLTTVLAGQAADTGGKRSYILAGTLALAMGALAAAWQFGLFAQPDTGNAQTRDVAANAGNVPSPKEKAARKETPKKEAARTETVKAEPKKAPDQAKAPTPHALPGLLDVRNNPARLAVSPDGERVAVGTENGKVGVWNVRTKQLMADFDSLTGSVFGLAFSAAGDRFAAFDSKGTLKLFDIPSKTEIWKLEQAGAKGWGVAFAAKDTEIIATLEKGKDSRIISVDAKTGKILQSAIIAAAQNVLVIPDSTIAAAGTMKKEILFWDFRKNEIVKTWPVPEGTVLTIGLSPDGKRLAAAGGSPWTKGSPSFIQVRDMATGDVLNRLNVSDLPGPLNAVRFSRDGSKLLTTGYGNQVRLWSIDSGDEVRRFPHAEDTKWLSFAEFALNGTAIVSAGKDGAAYVWPIGVASPSPAPVVRLALNPPAYQPVKDEVPAGFGANSFSKLFTPWRLNCWKPDSTGDYEILDLEGTRCLALRNGTGEPSLQMVGGSGKFLSKPGARYVARLEYRADPGLKGAFHIRKGDKYENRLAIDSLAGADAWQVATLEYTATEEHPLYIFVQNFSPTGERLYVKSVTFEEIEKPAAAKDERFTFVEMDNYATGCSVEEVFSPKSNPKLDFEDWGPKEVDGVPFKLIDPAGGRKNMLILYSQQGKVPPTCPESVVVPIGGAKTKAIHFLGCINGWGYPYGPNTQKGSPNVGVLDGTVSVIIRLKYADGKIEDVEWRNGDQLVDYQNRTKHTRGPKVAFELKENRQIRYQSVVPKRDVPVVEMEIMKGQLDRVTAPMFFAITVER